MLRTTTNKRWLKTVLCVCLLIGADSPVRSQDGTDADSTERMSSLAYSLLQRQQFVEAIPLYRAVVSRLRLHKPVREDELALALNNFAYCLEKTGEHDAECRRAYEEALTLCRRLGPDSQGLLANVQNNLGVLYKNAEEYEKAEDALREALDLRRRLLGEHRLTGSTLNNYGSLLLARGKYLEAETYLLEAMDVYAEVDESDIYMHHSIGKLGLLKVEQGDYAAAEVLLRKALGFFRSAHMTNHPDTSTTLSHLAYLYSEKADFDRAELLYREQLAFDHRHRNSRPAILNNLGRCLIYAGKPLAAESCYREALQLNVGRTELSAIARMNLGKCLIAQGKFADARNMLATVSNLPPYHTWRLQKLLAQVAYADSDPIKSFQHFENAIRDASQRIGTNHPALIDTRIQYASALFASERIEAAIEVLTTAAQAFRQSRLRAGFSGFDRIDFAANRSPLSALAVCLANRQRPRDAWRALEENCARGTLDEVSSRALRRLTERERVQEDMLGAEIRSLEAALMSGSKDERSTRTKLDQTLASHLELQQQLLKKYGVTAGQVYGLKRIQSSLDRDEAIVMWVDWADELRPSGSPTECWACVVRANGAPRWVPLAYRIPPSSDELTTAEKLRKSISTPETNDWKRHASEVAGDFFSPVEPHLGSTQSLPKVKSIIAVPAGEMNGIPLDLLTDQYNVSYVPSGTLHTWLKERASAKRPRSQRSLRLLAVGDPVVRAPPVRNIENPPPPAGVLITGVVAESNAAAAGLETGDVLLAYSGIRIDDPSKLRSAMQNATSDIITVQIWRAGRELERTVRTGSLGIQFAALSADRAMAQENRLHKVARLTRDTMQELPGAAREIAVVSRLFSESTVFAREQATKKNIIAMSESGDLANYDILHFATHGRLDKVRSMNSALLLSEPGDHDAKVYGSAWLSARDILQSWKLEASLVTLSACETGLGEFKRGEGYLGFSQALFAAGANSLVLSQWKVDDLATALLMERFYRNLCGDDAEGVAAQPKHVALRNAKAWLRTLTPVQLAAIVSDFPAAERGKVRSRVTTNSADARHPFAHPYYWAGFILIGDHSAVVSNQ